MENWMKEFTANPKIFWVGVKLKEATAVIGLVEEASAHDFCGRFSEAGYDCRCVDFRCGIDDMKLEEGKIVLPFSGAYCGERTEEERKEVCCFLMGISVDECPEDEMCRFHLGNSLLEERCPELYAAHQS